jgi:ribosome biogenesis protein Nip4
MNKTANQKQTFKAFLTQFGISQEIPATILGRSHFIVREKALLSNFPVWSGELVAHERGPVLIPSVDLLQRIGKGARHKVTVTSQAEWLFTCGRDIFAKSIKSHTSPAQGDKVAVLNEEKECIGYGEVMAPLDTQGKKPVIKRLFDLGDLLRRERKSKKVKTV